MLGLGQKQEPDEPTPDTESGGDEPDDSAVSHQPGLDGLQSPEHPNHHMAGLFGADAHKRQRDAEWLARLHRPREDGD
jgi:hypothetical protein